MLARGRFMAMPVQGQEAENRRAPGPEPVVAAFAQGLQASGSAMRPPSARPVRVAVVKTGSSGLSVAGT